MSTIKGLMIRRTVTITSFVPLYNYVRPDGTKMDIQEAIDFEYDSTIGDMIEDFETALQEADFEASKATLTHESGPLGDLGQRIMYYEVNE